MRQIRGAMVLMMMMIMVIGRWGCDCCLEDEQNALLQIKAAFFYPDNYFDPFYSWGINADCCSWDGVFCNSSTGRVTTLYLDFTRYQDINGWYLNVSLFHPLEQLEYLSLPGNGIVDCMKNEGFERLATLHNLKYLDLRANNFTNNILSSLAALKSLKSLNLAENRLNGTFHLQELDAMRDLEELGLGGNQIDRFLASKGNNGPRNLSVLFLDGIRVEGRSNLLESLGAFPHLKSLSLGWSEFKGKVIGEGHYNLSNVEELYLDYSSLDDNSFQSFGATFSSLKLLSLGWAYSILPSHAFTFFTKALPKFKTLEHLHLDGSNMDGSILHYIRQMTSLKTLSLRVCQLTGTIPANLDLCHLKHLQELYISYNDLSGGLPSCLSNLTSLQRLDLSFNHLVGNISSSPIVSLTSLQIIDLSYNLFQIPISLHPFFNHSKLTFFSGEENKAYTEMEDHTSIPNFQLVDLTLSNGDTGEIPKFLYHQDNLEYVSLSHLRMRGEFPYWLLENNTELNTLHLDNNFLSGHLQLPNHSLSNLRFLDFSNNQLHGYIPVEIGAYFPSLQLLNLSGNGFNGSIPSSLGNMKSLTRLDLSNNRLSGTIPEHLTMGCTSLFELLLSNNSLDGQIFPNNSNLKLLDRLELGGNYFIGNIPNSLSNSFWLSELDVSHNHLSGTIPSSLSNCTGLTILDASGNHFSGTIPEWIGNMSSLQVLDLSENSFSGDVPTSFNSSVIKEVYLSKNKLQGSLARAFYNCTSLVRLVLSHNLLSGSIPTWIGRLSELSILLLDYNNLEGGIPTALCKLHKLSLINLSNNKLSGSIPYCLKCSSEFNRLYNNSGPIPAPSTASPPMQQQQPVEFTTKSFTYLYQGNILELLSGIDLSCNNLKGRIPLEFGSLSNIQVMNLSHNNLTGSIPSTFYNLDEIESLDLSHNNLQGNFPPRLIDLNSLSFFNVSCNNLSGSTPQRVGQFATFDESSYRENPFLCGWPLLKSCTTAASPLSIAGTSMEDEESYNFVDMDVFYISFGVSYVIVLLGIVAVLYINPYWKRVWFYYVQVCTESCYYFIIDIILFRFKL